MIRVKMGEIEGKLGVPVVQQELPQSGMNVSISMHSPLLSIIVPSPQPSQPKSMAVTLRGMEGSGSADCCAAGVSCAAGVCCTALPLSEA